MNNIIKFIIFANIVIKNAIATTNIPGTINAISYNDYYYKYNSNNTTKPQISNDNKNAIGQIVNSEWLKYNVNISKEDNYKISYIISSKTDIPIDLNLFLLLDNNNCGKASLSQKIGEYNNSNFKSNDWTTNVKLISSNYYKLPKGNHNLTMCFNKASWINFAGIEIHANKTLINIPINTPPSIDNNIYTYNYINWSTKNSQLMLNNKAFHLKGLNWFGFNNDDRNLLGLNTRSMEGLLDFINANGFNVLRIPITVQLMFNIETSQTKNCNSIYNDCSLNSKGVLLKLFDEAAKRGIFILIDMHSRSDNNYLDPIWWGDDYTTENFISAWDIALKLFGDKPNLFGIDLFNEPHTIVNWGKTNDKYDWYKFANELTTHIYYTFPNFDKFIMIEGIGYAKDYRDYFNSPLDFSYLSDDLDNRVILSGHFYGFAISSQLPMFYDPNYPNNLNADFDEYLGTLKEKSGRAYVIGETGGTLVDKDKAWMETFAKYLVKNCYEDVFYWALNPESSDTGGLLENDYYTPRYDKLAIYKTIQPNPSNVLSEIKNNYLRIDFGQFANNACNT